MRRRPAVTVLMLITAVILTLPLRVQQKDVAQGPRFGPAAFPSTCAATALPAGGQQGSVAPGLSPARAYVAASLPRHGGVKPPLRLGGDQLRPRRGHKRRRASVHSGDRRRWSSVVGEQRNEAQNESRTEHAGCTIIAKGGRDALSPLDCPRVDRYAAMRRGAGHGPTGRPAFRRNMLEGSRATWVAVPFSGGEGAEGPPS